MKMKWNMILSLGTLLEIVIYSRIISNIIYLDAYYHPELCDHTWENKALGLFINVCWVPYDTRYILKWELTLKITPN